MIMARTLQLTSFFCIALVGIGLSEAATSGELADDRDGLVIILRHGLTDKAIGQYWGASNKANAMTARKAAFDGLASFNVQVVALRNEPTINPDALPAECLGSIDAPNLSAPNDGYQRGIDQKVYDLAYSPCYSLATTQFVEKLVADSLVSYFGDPPSAASEGMRNSMVEVLKEENQLLYDRLAALELLVVQLQAKIEQDNNEAE